MSFPLAAETGTIRKKWTGRLPVALIYPNVYPVAVSSLGCQLVYALLNVMDDIVCERFVYPAAGEPLRSLESNRPLTDFPLVLGSISFEEDYPRLVAMLGAGGLEAFSAGRPAEVRAGAPLVILGGVAVFMNPEPLAPFADLMVIGEAEPLLPPLIALLRDLLAAGASRHEAGLAVGRSIRGCYVPALYTFHYSPQGIVSAIEPAEGLPPRVSKVVAGRMERAGHSRLLSPEAELGMYMTELGRGCSRGCRFCAAGYIYRPPRLWDVEAVTAALLERPPGMDRIGLLGMEMAAPEVLDSIAGYLNENDCRLSFSSLRADRISDRLLALLARSELKSAAIAPDGASERLRRVINKGLTEQDLLSAAEKLVSAGITHLKLYVMIGLPSETEEDLAELIAMIRRLQKQVLPIGRKRGRVSELSLSVNCFVPKPWTPFQYLSFGGLGREEAQSSRNESTAVMALKKKIRYLRKGLADLANLRIKADRPERTLVQAVFARGDRRLAPVLFDLATGESLKRSMKKYGLRPWQYAIRPREREELFPWDIIDHGISKQFLWQELDRSLRESRTAPCLPAGCERCGVCHEDISA